MDLPGSDWGDFSCRRAVDSSSCLLDIQEQTLGKVALVVISRTTNVVSDLRSQITANYLKAGHL